MTAVLPPCVLFLWQGHQAKGLVTTESLYPCVIWKISRRRRVRSSISKQSFNLLQIETEERWAANVQHLGTITRWCLGQWQLLENQANIHVFNGAGSQSTQRKLTVTIQTTASQSVKVLMKQRLYWQASWWTAAAGKLNANLTAARLALFSHSRERQGWCVFAGKPVS